MKNTHLINAIVVLCCALAGSIAEAQASQRTSTLKKLDVFVGSWTFEWDAKPSIFGPGGKITGLERFEWLPGGFFLQMIRVAKGSTAEFRNSAMFAYDPAMKAYTQRVFNLNTGWSGSFSGTENGNTWTWSSSGADFRQRVDHRDDWCISNNEVRREHR